MHKVEKNFNDPKFIRQNIESSKKSLICINCFDTKGRGIKKEDVIRIPKKTVFEKACHGCTNGVSGVCDVMIKTMDSLGGRDLDYIPVTHRCIRGRLDSSNGNVISMTTPACPVCNGVVYEAVGKTIIISIIGSRDSGKSHFVGILLNELIGRLARQFRWNVDAPTLTRERCKEHHANLFVNKQRLALTQRNHSGLFEPYVFWITPLEGEAFTLVFFDTAGEDFEDNDSIEYAAKHAFHTSGIIFLIDPLKLVTVSNQIEDKKLFGSTSINAVTSFRSDAILGILSQSIRHHGMIRERWQIKIPMAVSIPKIDAVTTIMPNYYTTLSKSPHGANGRFISSDCKHVNGEIQKWLKNIGDGVLDSFMMQIDVNYSNYSYFPFSALGLGNSPNQNGVFETPVPHRVEDPLLWILTENGLINKR